MEKWSDKAIEMIMEYGPKVVLAIVVLILGFFIANKLTKLIKRLMDKRGVEVSLQSFVGSLVSVLLKAMVVISVADMVGVETTSFVAVIGAAGLAVGLALQGTLQNFAGGALIMIFKPFKVGDLIEAQGHIGSVKEIQIFVTTLLTPENKTVIIPNGAISNGNITNYTVEGKIRVDLNFGISYNADIKAAKETLLDVMTSHDKVLKNPAPFVGVESLGDSSVNLAVRPYTKPEDYWDVYFYVYEKGKEALDKVNVEIPFPQVVVHMDK
ncbi:MAG: mechanosensitive ion channel [Chlorobi bacterium]|nr:mechanosensitive ion channel [Chlorobiota bacterium]